MGLSECGVLSEYERDGGEVGKGVERGLWWPSLGIHKDRATQGGQMDLKLPEGLAIFVLGHCT